MFPLRRAYTKGYVLAVLLSTHVNRSSYYATQPVLISMPMVKLSLLGLSTVCEEDIILNFLGYFFLCVVAK